MYRGPNIVRDALVFGYDTGYGVSNNLVSTRFNLGEPTTNLSNNTTLEKRGNNEYLPYESIVGIIDTYGVGTYSFSFDLKSDIAGLFSVYTTDGAERKYTFTSKSVSATTNWNRYNITVDITLVNSAFTVNNISFYGTYGTGKIPTVKNMQIEKKSHSTPFTPTSRSNTESLLDLTRNNVIDLNNVSFDSNSQMYFNGSSDNNIVDLSSIPNFSQITFIGWFYSNIGTNTCLLTSTPIITHFRGAGFYLRGNDSSASGYLGWDTPPLGNTWNMISSTWDGSTMKLYLNGVKQSTELSYDGGINGLLQNNGNYTFGGYFNSSQPWTNGMLPIAKIYNRALNQNEISQNFNAYKNRFNIV